MNLGILTAQFFSAKYLFHVTFSESRGDCLDQEIGTVR